MRVENRHVKYVFADIVRFTEGRTVEAQMEIISALNEAFVAATSGIDKIFLPTGDGICAALIQPNATHDAHLKVAVAVMKAMHQWSAEKVENRRCGVRFGINESVDCLILDINGRQNIAGAGINQAQRLMALADESQIVVGRAAYDSLRAWDEYVLSFRAVRAESKHGVIIEAFQYIQTGIAFLSTKMPKAVSACDPIDLRLADILASEPETAHPRALYNAVSAWEDERANAAARIRRAATTLESKAFQGSLPEGTEPVLSKLFEAAEAAFDNYHNADTEFMDRLRRIVPGSMYRTICADRVLRITRERVKLLRALESPWFDQ